MDSQWSGRWQWQVNLQKDISMWGAMCKSVEEAKTAAEKAYRLLKREYCR